MDKDIAREKHHIQFLPAVFPPADAAIHRQEGTHMPLFQLPRDLLLMAGTHMGGIPVGLQRCSPLLDWLQRLGRSNEFGMLCQFINSCCPSASCSFAPSLTGHL